MYCLRSLRGSGDGFHVNEVEEWIGVSGFPQEVKGRRLRRIRNMCIFRLGSDMMLRVRLYFYIAGESDRKSNVESDTPG